jgi:hypothetical protein
MPLSSVLGAQSLIKPGVCTSSTRPASPYEGQTIYETDTDLVKSYNGTSWVTIGPTTIPTAAVTAIQAARVATSQTTTSTSYTDLTTSGPAVTLTTGTAVIITVSSDTSNSAANANANAGNTHMGVAVSGASTVSAADTHCARRPQIHSSHTQTISSVFYLDGLTAGSNTFTAKYKVSATGDQSAGTGTFANRNITVIAI